MGLERRGVKRDRERGCRPDSAARRIESERLHMPGKGYACGAAGQAAADCQSAKMLRLPRQKRESVVRESAEQARVGPSTAMATRPTRWALSVSTHHPRTRPRPCRTGGKCRTFAKLAPATCETAEVSSFHDLNSSISTRRVVTFRPTASAARRNAA